MEYIVLKAKTREEVADEYGINVRTLYRWLNRADIKISRGIIKPCSLRIIYDTFGVPGRMKIA